MQPLCRLGADVLGLDAAETSIQVARDHAAADPLLSTLQYESDTAESVAAQGRTFDIVVASEVLEHVSDTAAFLDAAVQLVKPGGHLVVTTINKTPASYMGAIVAAEQLLGLVPKHTHTWEKFVTPDALQQDLEHRGMRTMQMFGMVYNPLSLSWTTTTSFTQINYLLHATKPVGSQTA